MKRLSLLIALVALVIPVLAAGPVAAASMEIFTTSLNSASENPRVNETGTGDAQIVVNAAGTQVTYTVSYINLSGPVVAGHIHFGAVDQNGPIILPFVVGPSPMHGTLTAANFQKTSQAPTFASAV